MSDLPYLSLIASSRNDDHGGNTLYRTQIFIDSFLQQCEQHQLRAELILVEWNPPQDRSPLAEVIDWRHQNPWVDCRIITVPFERHILLRFARTLPLFQMIAKNVGIRRARGEFILATNIDILFSDELMALLAKKALRADRHYRCDRFDVDSQIPIDISLGEKLQYAKENLVRRNHRMHPPEIAALQARGAPLEDLIRAALNTSQFAVETETGVPTLTINSNAPALWLHTNGCGDFTLLHRDAWKKIRGYAEFEMFSLHLDSLGIATAHHAGIRETWFPPPAVCYHIEHALGSGLTQENQTPLFERIEQQGISWFDYDVIKPLLNEKQPFQFNTEKWGLRDIPLDETVCTCQGFRIQNVPSALQAAPYAAVTALHPELNTDRYFRNTLRHLSEHLQIQLRSRMQSKAAKIQMIRQILENINKEWGFKLQQFSQRILGRLGKVVRRLSSIRKVFQDRIAL
ncbi:MAG: hypothetical protein C5B47_06160 [Verrucomicrobia bacterium]|nr:MAG: hypothetical protein C5B47_06160 [Verrucomicrobiota bacterium]